MLPQSNVVRVGVVQYFKYKYNTSVLTKATIRACCVFVVALNMWYKYLLIKNKLLFNIHIYRRAIIVNIVDVTY